MRLFRIYLCGGCLLLLARCGGGGDAISGPPPMPMPDPVWSESACTAVTGTAAISVSRDDGASLFGNPDSGQPTSSVFAFGLVAADRVDTLFAAVNDGIFISEDVGCGWRQLLTLPTNQIVRLTSGDSGRVYAYTEGETRIFRIGPDGALDSRMGPVTPGELAGFPARSGVLRLAGRDDGRLFHSGDGGVTWAPIGSSPAVDLGLQFYFAAFDPADPDHLVMGTTRVESGDNGAGVWTSFNGGASWTQAQGFAGRANGFSGTISATDPATVWVLALDVDNPDLERRRIYRSTDGGRSFVSVVTAGGQLVLTNGTRLFTGSEPNKVYFAVTDPTNVIDRMTHLYRYDDGTGHLTTSDFPWTQVGEIRAMAFNPDHPTNLITTKTHQLLR